MCHTSGITTICQKQECDLDSHNFVDEYGVTLRPQGAEDVHKVVDIE
jgi:hypothetical protein